jgi:hypothetical protein
VGLPARLAEVGVALKTAGVAVCSMPTSKVPQAGNNIESNNTMQNVICLPFIFPITAFIDCLVQTFGFCSSTCF